MTLHLYFARRFAWGLAWVFTGFALLSAMFQMVEILRRFRSDNVGFLEILWLTALKVPAGLYQILPLIVILATLSTFLGLARNSELVIARAAGRSALRTLASPIVVALALGLFSVAVFNPIAAGTTKQFEHLASRHTDTRASVLSISPEGLWLRQGSPDGQTVIKAQRANRDGTELFSVTFFGFRPDGAPEYRIEGASARLEDGAWVVRSAKRWTLSDPNPELTATSAAQMRLPSDLTLEQIRSGFAAPSSIPIWRLPGFIDQLEKAGFSARRHRVWLQTELAQPFLLVTMVMIGAAFTMGHTRFGHTGLMVVVALLLGFGLYFVRNFAQVLGENGQLPVLLAAWVPPAAGILLAMGFLLHLEDG